MEDSKKVSRKEFILSLVRYGIVVALAVLIGYLVLNREVKTDAECPGTAACEN